MGQIGHRQRADGRQLRHGRADGKILRVRLDQAWFMRSKLKNGRSSHVVGRQVWRRRKLCDFLVCCPEPAERLSFVLEPDLDGLFGHADLFGDFDAPGLVGR